MTLPMLVNLALKTIQSWKYELAPSVSESITSPYVLVSLGKSAERMYINLQKQLGDAERAIVAGPYPYKSIHTPDSKTLFLKTDHPVPREHSFNAAKAIAKLLRELPTSIPILFAVSGGSSASLASPKPPLSLSDLTHLNSLLLNSGLDIQELNQIRIFFSAIKGGQLLKLLPDPKNYIGALVSDVPGDDLNIIGSGPTVPQNVQKSTVKRLLAPFWDKLPSAIRAYWDDFHDIDTFEFPDNNHLIASPKMLSEKVCEAIERASSLKPKVGTFGGEVSAAASLLIQDLKKGSDKEILIRYGESTVSVAAGGKGGRNQDLAIRCLLEAERQCMKDVFVACIGTDGVDGPTDAAGAWLSSEMLEHARSRDISPETYLQASNSYHFFESLGFGHIKCGPTGHNFMDLIILAKNLNPEYA